MSCPGSPAAEEHLPDITNPLAEEGSCAHLVAELTLKSSSVKPADLIGATFHDTLVTEEMAFYVSEYVEYVNEINEITDIEVRVEFDEFISGGYGTADAVIITDSEVHIIDLKYGRGKVDAENNTQLMLYALGKLTEYPNHNFVLHIVQPRIKNFSVWGISAQDLMNWATTTLKNAVDLTQVANPPRIPGETQCKFCKAAATCKPLFDHTYDVLSGMFANEMNSDETQRILDNKKLIEKFLKAVEANSFKDLLDGYHVPGYKLVYGKKVRQWSPLAEKEISTRLDKEGFTNKIKGIGDIRKLLGEEFISEYTIPVEPKLTIAKVDDKRPEIDINLA